MTTPRRGLLFHFTHLSNLKGIATDGLYCDTEVHLSDRLETEVANPAIKSPRRRRRVPIGPGGVVADYVPFYFAARSPMLGSITTGRVGTYQAGQDGIVYLVTSTDRVRELRLPFVFTDRNAYYPFARYSDDLTELDDLVDWELMEGRWWHNTVAEPDRMERRMAEFLVHHRVPWEAFVGIGARTDEACRQVVRVLSTVGVSTTVLPRPGWYFR